jgi:CHAD domain-containing protein
VTILDTFDGRVRRGGAWLTRHRDGKGFVLTWHSRGTPCITVRVDNPVSFAWDVPEGVLRDALADIVGVRRLLPQAVADVHGTLFEVLDDRSKTIARVRVETGRARPAEGAAAWALLPSVITLTGVRGYAANFHELVPVIESRPTIEPSPEDLGGIILDQVGAPATHVKTVKALALGPDVRSDTGARQIHLALLADLEANESGVRGDVDTEFLHDFRVAVRRTRSLLGQAKYVFPPAVVERFATGFSWIGGVTGPARDLDVLLLAMRGYRELLPDNEFHALMAFLHGRQQRAHRALVEALDSDTYRSLVAEWRAYLSEPLLTEPEPVNAGRPLADVAAARAWRLSRRIAESAASVGEGTPAAHVHAIRVMAKKLRYLVDVTPGFYDNGALTCVLTALKSLQRALGDFNDAEVQGQRFLEYQRGPDAAEGGPVLSAALSRLAAHSTERRERLRADIFPALERFGADETRSACRRAFRRKSAESAV